MFGDTFSGRRVGRGDWRSPVILIGTGDANQRITYDRAGGPEHRYAKQLWHYEHDDVHSGWSRSGISTVIPSDLLRVDDMLYLHVIVNRGFGTVVWTEIWASRDSGVSWSHLGDDAIFPAALHDGHAQCWSWDHNPDDGWVYVASTGFQRDKGIVLQRVRPHHLGDRFRYQAWGLSAGRWCWGASATPITPAGERWGELSLRRLGCGRWVLGGFAASRYALGYRVISAPTTPLETVPVQTPVVGSSWEREDHRRNRVAQLYGGYVLPGSVLDVPGGVGLMVSQWHTDRGWPYRVMQFRATLQACGMDV